MRYAVSSSEMKRYDRNTSEYFGISSEVLMERASLKIADNIDRWKESRNSSRKLRVLVLAGSGNNGGDGVCAGRILSQRGYVVNICLVGDPAKYSDLLISQLKTAEKYGISSDTFSNIRDNKSISDWDIIIDAMFGIGLSRPVTGVYADAASYCARCKEERKEDIFIVSVDVPSGINADDGSVCNVAVKADITVTFNQVKLGHILYPGCEYTGKLIVEDAGITDESFLGNPPTYFYYDKPAPALLPERKRDSNKGSNGKVLIIAGSRKISGACILAASACLKMGAGMVRIFTASENAETVKTLIPEALLDTYDDFEPVKDKLLDAMKWSTGCVLGPGIGTDQKGEELLKAVLKDYDKDLVLDADALNLAASDKELEKLVSNYARFGKKLILTPHLAEFSRLYGSSVSECKENILTYPAELAKRLHCSVVCKDARSVVADNNEKKIYINVSGNDGMATAGSGDVLSGILGALLIFYKSSFEVSCVGTYIHGCAGDLAAGREGRISMTAMDIVTELPGMLRSAECNGFAFNK